LSPSSQNKPNTGDLTRISNLERDIAASQHDLNKLQEKTTRIEQDIKDLEKKILEIGGSKLLAQKSKVDGIRTLIGIANDEITKAEVTRNKAEKDSTRLEGTLADNSATLQELESEVQQLEERLQELANEVAQLKEKVEAAQSAADNSKEDLENLKTELDAKEDEISGFRQREVCLLESHIPSAHRR
jgi:structural maintenance of chromosome 4